MRPETFLLIKLTAGAVATIGLYSVLYRETKLYRFFEHIFVGLAVGYSIVILWTETLYPLWWQKMVGQAATKTDAMQNGMWLYVVLLPIGLMGYLVFSKKHNWMSRIPIGVILGAWSGQQVMNWYRTFSPQVLNSMQPVWPTTWESIRVPAKQVLGEDGQLAQVSPEVLAQINANVYPTQALSNVIFVITLLAAMSYFIFSFELKGKFMTSFNMFGRWMLMVGFGCIFGATVMARFALVIDRMSFMWQEWLMAVLRTFTGG